mmetsp:Transcript_14022/g.16530  ORF Transcript_14022/g.16530 Transcript_14022/m.16530 type:complete len:234 (+) Transcript_14022:1-702(+)
MIRVTAPSTLPAGYTFDAQVGSINQSMMVTVPEGGVTAGQVFLVPRPDGDMTKLIRAPTGYWKDGLFDCFANGINAAFCCALCCTQLGMAQVMQRMRLDWLGMPGDEESTKNTYKVVTAIVCSYLVYMTALNIYIQSFLLNNDAEDLSLFAYYAHDLGNYAFSFWSIVALCRTRRSVRETYSIPGSDCEDCLHSTFCSCCTVARIARHTGEFETYPPTFFSETGLGAHAPMAV